ncbi:MAG: cysteine peptidase family C39 domain-containing protein [bacterium]
MTESKQKPKYKTFVIHGKTKQWQFWVILAILLVLVFWLTSYAARYLALNDPRLQVDVVDRDGVILQTTGYSCGPASLTMLMRDKGLDVTQLEMAKVAYTGIFGTQSSAMPRVGDKYGFDVDTKYLNFDEIIDMNVPMILEEEEHVVYIVPDLASRILYVKDPQSGLFIMAKDDFYTYFLPKEKKKCYIFTRKGIKKENGV